MSCVVACLPNLIRVDCTTAGCSDALATHVHVEMELSRARTEAAEEVTGFQRSWAQHADKLTKVVVRGKLAPHWVVQEHPGEDDSYLDLRTGTAQTEHPLMKRAKALLRQHKAEAMGTLQERIALIGQYRQQLRHSREARQAEVGWGFAFVAVCVKRLLLLMCPVCCFLCPEFCKA